MKESEKLTRKLTLKKETVRELTEADLKHVAGGTSNPCSWTYPPQCPLSCGTGCQTGCGTCWAEIGTETMQ